jgi:hypothetical protein
METSSQVEVLEAQIRECYGRVVWTHKTHEKCTDILNDRNNTIKMWQIILSAVTTSGIFITVLGKSEAAGIVSAIISMLTLALTTYVKKYDLGGMAQKHADAASSIWNVREKYLSLLTDIRAGVVGVDEIRTIREKLQDDLHKLYKGSPRTLTKAYYKASEALKKMEEMTFSDEEIDKFLPKSLKKSRE